jgi:hypothetical protein
VARELFDFDIFHLSALDTKLVKSIFYFLLRQVFFKLASTAKEIVIIRCNVHCYYNYFFEWRLFFEIESCVDHP